MQFQAGVAVNCCILSCTYLAVIVGLISVASLSVTFQRYYENISPAYIRKHYHMSHTKSYYTATSTSAAVAFITAILSAAMGVSGVAIAGCSEWWQGAGAGDAASSRDSVYEEVVRKWTSRSSKRCNIS